MTTKEHLMGIDFVLDCIDRGDTFCDYWFRVRGESQRILTERYQEQSMVSVTAVVYDTVARAMGVKCLYPCNYQVISPDDPELRNILEALVGQQNNPNDHSLEA